jgi:hypothetical protein
MKTPNTHPYPMFDWKKPDYEWYKVTEYETDNPMLSLFFGEGIPRVEFSVRGVPDNRHEWFAETLHRQISYVLATAVHQTTSKFQFQLRHLAGLE